MPIVLAGVKLGKPGEGQIPQIGQQIATVFERKKGEEKGK